MIKKYRGLFVCIVLFLITFLLGLKMGTVKLSVTETLQLLFWNQGTKENQLIFHTFRIPRVLTACLVGISLSMSGEILQKITRNKIADAGILGVSSGVAFGGVFYFFLLGNYVENLTVIGEMSLMFFGLLGAIFALSLNLILSVSHGKLNMSRFILNGIGISSGFSALVTFFSLKINADNFSQVNSWLQGSISQSNWSSVQKMSYWILPILLLLFILSPKLSLLKFSDTHLESIGFQTTWWRLIFILFAAILICVSVLNAGTIGFVGLIVPALTKIFFKSEGKGYLLGVCLNGMSLLLICDLLARTLFIPNELPLNAMLGIIGVPYLIYLVYQSRKGVLTS